MVKPDSIPELRGKAARQFEARVRKPPTPQQKWVLKKAELVYKTIKKE